MKNWGRLPTLKPGTFPRFPGLWALWGPGVIWWPYVIAKYGLAFLFLLIPACLLQYPLNYEIGRYTLLTGESIFQGFIRLNRWFALLLWVLMTMSFLWFGAFASAGGTALAALTHFPSGWTERGQTLFWAYSSMAVFFLAILFSRVVYRLVETVMSAVAVLTLAGLIWACFHPCGRRFPLRYLARDGGCGEPDTDGLRDELFSEGPALPLPCLVCGICCLVHGDHLHHHAAETAGDLDCAVGLDLDLPVRCFTALGWPS